MLLLHQNGYAKENQRERTSPSKMPEGEITNHPAKGHHHTLLERFDGVTDARLPLKNAA
jgi:hypothetical protein